MDLESCKDPYRRMSLQVFSEWRIPLKMYLWDAPMGNPWYSGKKMETAVKEVLRARISRSEQAYLGVEFVSPEEAPLLPMQDEADPLPRKART